LQQASSLQLDTSRRSSLSDIIIEDIDGNFVELNDKVENAEITLMMLTSQLLLLLLLLILAWYQFFIRFHVKRSAQVQYNCNARKKLPLYSRPLSWDFHLYASPL